MKQSAGKKRACGIQQEDYDAYVGQNWKSREELRKAIFNDYEGFPCIISR